MDNVDILVIGAGVIGLAVASELAKKDCNLYVVEKNSSFGQETSSRNSEVIHAGIYYPKGSLKSLTCLEGNKLLYEFCEKENIPHKRIGKLIVAKDFSEQRQVEKLFKHALSCGVEDLELLEGEQIKGLEPNIKACLAIYSISTGIIDSHCLMSCLAAKIKSNGGQIVYDSCVEGILKEEDGFCVEIIDSSKEAIRVKAKIVINSAGLNSDKVAQMAGIKDDSYNLKFCKGEYFRVSMQKSKLVSRLIYPVPDKNGRDLGIHFTPDLTGSARLGPDAFYLPQNILDYSVDRNKRGLFYQQTKDFLPFISEEDLTEDTTGIRPKLQGPNDSFRDFIVKHETDRGLDGFINLVGIESPGLTASLSIARLVKKEIQRFLN